MKGLLQKFYNIRKSSFLKNVAIVATGTAGAQAITISIAPVITRLYGPEAFGLLGTFMAIVTILTPIAALTYPIAIVLPKLDSDARLLAKISTILAIIISFLFLFLLILTGEWLSVLLNLQSIEFFLYLVPLIMLFSAFQQILQQWLIRKKRFSVTAKVAVAHALTINLAKAGVGLVNPTGVTLIVIATLGNAVHSMLLFFGNKKPRLPSEFSTHLKDNDRKADSQPGSATALAKKYIDFPIFRAPQAALNAVSQSIPIIILGSFFGPPSAGFYALTRGVLVVPINILSKAIGDVFYPKAADKYSREEPVFRDFVYSTLLLGGVGFLPFSLIIIMGPYIFGLIFGADWTVAGMYAQWMSIWLYFAFMNRPSVALISILGLNHFFVIYEILSLLLRVFSLYIGFYFFDSDVYAVACFSISGMLLNIVLIMYVGFKAKYTFAVT